MLPRYRKLPPSSEKLIQQKYAEEEKEESECSSSESEDLEVLCRETTNYAMHEFPMDYWWLLKSAKYISYGKSVLTAMSLIIMQSCDFQNPIILQALKDNQIVNVLLNVLAAPDKRVQTISLRCLQKLGKIRILRHEIVYLGGIQSMVELLEQPQMGLKRAAAESIAAVANFHKAWRIVRESKGIPLLVNMMYLPIRLLNEDPENLGSQLTEVVNSAESAVKTLFTICECKKNQREFLLRGTLYGCQNILKTSHVKLLTATMQLLQRCAEQKYIRIAIRNLKMLEDFRAHFYSEDQGLMQAAAQAAFKCAEGTLANDFFRKQGFVDKVFEILQTSTFHSDETLMVSISGAIWKCSEDPENVKRLQALNAMPLMVQLLTSQPPSVQQYLVACLSCCITQPQCRTTIRKNSGLETLVVLLQTIHPPLIMHLNKAIAEATVDNDCMAILEKLNALRLVWSHLKNNNPSVVSNTAWQLCRILQNMKSSANYVRSLVGGIQLLTELLSSKNTRVLTPICALIVVLSKEPENLALLTDYYVVSCLSKLTPTRCRRLRYHLCMAIATCCSYRNNRAEFGERGVVRPLIRMLRSSTLQVSWAACHALYQLSYIPKWCMVMFNSEGVFPVLMKLADSRDRDVQTQAAGILRNMRLFSLNRDKNVPDWLIQRHNKFIF